MLPNQFDEVVRLYNRMTKLKPTTLLEGASEEEYAITGVSGEGRKKQILEEARHEVLQRIREAL